MSLPNLDNLVKTGQLKVEPMNRLEFSGLLRSGEARLHDAANPFLAAESQFDLAYNAAHSLSLAALRWHGYHIEPGKMTVAMIKQILVFCVAIHSLNTSQAISYSVELQSKNIQEKLNNLSEVEKISTKVNKDVLPVPYNYLLTQPLMTKGIENYYQRRPFIQIIHATKNHHNNTYSRAIVMLIDSNKARNNVRLAQRKKEATVVELAFITINFKELPTKIIKDVVNTKVPFGQLLSKNNLKISTKDRTYFWIICDQVLASFTDCHLNSKLYGRRNTIIKASNNKWLAHVVEILKGH